MSDAPTIAGVAIAALGLGAGALRLAQMAMSRNGAPKSAGLSAAEWEAKIAHIVAEHSNSRILPLLNELKEIAQKQVDIQTKQNEILVELVTVSRVGRRQ